MKLGTSRRRLLQAAGSSVVLTGAATDQPPPAAIDQARVRLAGMIGGFQMTQMIHVASKLRIADHLKHGSKPVSELAALTETHPDSLYRLLRTLAGSGVFFEEEGPRFRLTPMAELLRSDAPGSLQVMAETSGEHWMWRPWGDLMHSVKTGQVAFDHLYGKHTWEWFAENPGPAELFNALMDEGTNTETQAIVKGYDFSRAQKVVDIGGGRGALLAAILGSNPSARGILFDLPHVIDSAKQQLDSGLASRIEFTSGDFFKAVPEGGDLYLLKNIIHDWSDEESRAILGSCHRSMRGRGRLMLIERVICAPNQPCRAKTMDMQMMVRNGGRNRTEKEYRELLAASGFALSRLVPTAVEHSLIEAAPAG